MKNFIKNNYCSFLGFLLGNTLFYVFSGNYEKHSIAYGVMQNFTIAFLTTIISYYLLKTFSTQKQDTTTYLEEVVRKQNALNAEVNQFLDDKDKIYLNLDKKE